MEMNSGSLTWHYCLRRPTGTWWQVDYIGLLSFWKSQWFILTEIDTYSDIFSRYRCDFPAPRVLANTTMYGFPEGLILRNRTLHKLAFHQMSYCNVEVYQICLITGVSIVFLRCKIFLEILSNTAHNQVPSLRWYFEIEWAYVFGNFFCYGMVRKCPMSSTLPQPITFGQPGFPSTLRWML